MDNPHSSLDGRSAWSRSGQCFFVCTPAEALAYMNWISFYAYKQNNIFDADDLKRRSLISKETPDFGSKFKQLTRKCKALKDREVRLSKDGEDPCAMQQRWKRIIGAECARITVLPVVIDSNMIYFLTTKMHFFPTIDFLPLFLNEDGRIRGKRLGKLHCRFRRYSTLTKTVLLESQYLQSYDDPL